jgi:D-alanyl-D-alanine carboxypeptidase/D-alanyl-D-alanine-endopeptidase (penicillin-binding protein 4)
LTVAADADLDTAVVSVSMAPASVAGKPGVVTLTPANDYVRLINQSVTGAAGSARTIGVARVHGTNDLLVTGSVPLGGASSASLRTFGEPELMAASLFRAALAKHGVRVTQPVTRRAATPAGSLVASVQSPPLRDFLPQFLKLSNNGHAEILLKSLGRKVYNRGTADDGAKAIATFLTANGIDAKALRTVDGAGLSRQDLVTPEQISQLLMAVKTKPWFATWYAALPIAGEPDRLVGGTLASRMVGTAAAKNVHGKTGTLTAVSALSGYVTNAGGQQLTFSVLINDHMASTVKPIEDSIAVLLANSGGPAAAAKRDLARIKAQPVPTDDPRTKVDENGLECSWAGRC